MVALRLSHLSKSFGAVAAVRDVSLELRSGEIHAVIGENGAGKSTLLGMAAGLQPPDAGTVFVGETPLDPPTPRAAIARGVAMVEQHFSLIDVFDATDNIQLGTEAAGPLGVLRRSTVRERIASLEKELGIRLVHDVPVGTLAVGERQRIEIVRALYRNAKVLILDEPTAVLTPDEATSLYSMLERLAAAGRAIAVVTHKLDEVRRHAHRVSVMRRGSLVASRLLDPGRPAEDELRELTQAIMGDADGPSTMPPPPPAVGDGEAPAPVGAEAGEILVALEDVWAGDSLHGVTLSVRAGEVVGLAGIEGNGQGELVDVLAGLLPPRSGSRRGGPAAIVFGDRHKEGLVLDASVAENLVLGELARFSRGGVVDTKAYGVAVEGRLTKAAVVPPDATLPARALSGGNQQKVVLARAVAAVERGVRVVVLAHPTRGVDLRAVRSIHKGIRRFRELGCAVLLVSADLDEIHALADRILVLSRGRIGGTFPPDASDDVIGRAMLGSAEAAS